jgi:hypothetical protein
MRLLGKALVAVVAHERLLPGVNAHVVHKRGVLGELLVTKRKVLVWSLEGKTAIKIRR